jgi:hypothetical protein
VGISNGSRLYELNHWMWHYGLGQPCRVTVEEAEQRHRGRLTEASKSTPDVEAATRRALPKFIVGAAGPGKRMQWEMNEEKMLWYIPWYIHIHISFNIP